MKLFAARLTVVAVLLACAGLAIVGRLFDVQILHGAEYRAQSAMQSQQRLVIKAERGKILDRKGRVLASNVESSIKMTMRQLEFMPDDTLRTPGAPRRGMAQLARVYPYGTLAAAVLGYVGKDGNGLGGLEFSYDKYLRGEDGWAMLQRDALGRNGRPSKYRLDDLPSEQPVDGADVVTTLDLDIQKITESVLRQTVQKWGAKAGMAMVMDPTTGRILGMANEPGFDANVAPKFTADQRLNRCVSENFEPGSTFKLVTAAAAIEQHVKKETDTINGNNGRYEIYGQTIKDHKPFGRISFADALAYSSNVCFAQVANELGNERFYAYTMNFGFGSRTGIELPGEEAGIVHPIAQWSGRSRVTIAIGQEISTTFLQMMTLYAAVANDGVLVEPRIVDRVVDVHGAVIDSSRCTPLRRVITAETAHRLAAMLAGVVTHGTGVKAQMGVVSVAGKTGTSQKFDKTTNTYSDLAGYASFIGFVPARDPVLVAGVVLDDPGKAEFGGTAAAPAFRQIVTEIISSPNLEFAEEVLGHDAGKPLVFVAHAKGGAVNRRASTPMPVVSGLTRTAAKEVLAASGFSFEVFGPGDTITGQTPDAGSQVGDSAVVILYAHHRGNAEAAGAACVVPDCRGRDLRDALNILNIRGLVPFVNGSGTVRSQIPAVGSMVRPAEICTLYCSFNG